MKDAGELSRYRHNRALPARVEVSSRGWTMHDASAALASAAQQGSCNVRRTKHAVQRRIEQVVANHDQSRMLDWFRSMGRTHVAQGTTARLAAHRARPAMHLAFDRPLTSFVVRGHRAGIRGRPQSARDRRCWRTTARRRPPAASPTRRTFPGHGTASRRRGSNRRTRRA